MMLDWRVLLLFFVLFICIFHSIYCVIKFDRMVMGREGLFSFGVVHFLVILHLSTLLSLLSVSVSSFLCKL